MKGIIIAAGIGRSEKAISGPEKLGKRLGLPYKVFNWQQYIEEESDELTILHTSYGSKVARLTRKLIYDYLYDETSYSEKRSLIIDKLREFIDESGFTEVVLIGHSWGSVIMYEYTRCHYGVSKLITMGCPIPFKHGLDVEDVYCDWFNYWEHNDGIAHQIFNQECINIEFKSKNWLKKFNLMVHSNYFGSRKMAKMIRKIL